MLINVTLSADMPDDLKKALWATADKLLVKMDATGYQHLVLGLIFLKYVSDTFTACRAEIQARLHDPTDEFHYRFVRPMPTGSLLRAVLYFSFSRRR